MINLSSLNKKIHSLREWKRIAEDADRAAAEITAELQSIMEEEGTDTLLGDDWKITWKPVSTTRIDSKALKAQMPAVYEAFAKVSTSRRFVLR